MSGPIHGEKAELVPLSIDWVWRGARAALSTGLLVLSFSMLGFGAFARDASFPLWQIIFMSMAVWALPSSLVFVATIAAGSGALAAAIAVALSAVRFLPMTISILPLLAAERVRRVWLVVAVHYVAVTAYVEGMIHLPKVPPDHRVAFYIGLGTSMMVIATAFSAVGFLIAGALPKFLSLGLVILSPIYFLLSMLKASTTLAERVALGGGLVLGPIAHQIDSELDLLYGGVLAGVIGYLTQRFRRSILS